jgi:hypothetical protein
MSQSLEQVLADARSDAKVLERRGVTQVSLATLEELCEAVRVAALPYLTWRSEAEAMLYTGKGRAWLRGKYEAWERDGNARRAPTNSRERQYREVVLPRRIDLAQVQADAEASARADARAGAA